MLGLPAAQAGLLCPRNRPREHLAPTPQSGTALSCGMALVMWLVAPRRAARVATTTLLDFRMLKWFCLRPLETFPWSEGSVFSKQRPGQAVSVEELGVVRALWGQLRPQVWRLRVLAKGPSERRAFALLS